MSKYNLKTAVAFFCLTTCSVSLFGMDVNRSMLSNGKVNGIKSFWWPVPEENKADIEIKWQGFFVQKLGQVIIRGTLKKEDSGGWRFDLRDVSILKPEQRGRGYWLITRYKLREFEKKIITIEIKKAIEKLEEME